MLVSLGIDFPARATLLELRGAVTFAAASERVCVPSAARDQIYEWKARKYSRKEITTHANTHSLKRKHAAGDLPTRNSKA